MLQHILIACLPLLCSAQPAEDAGRPVVVYVALDRVFAEPILEHYRDTHGVQVRAVYDNESTKTVGLVNRIRIEQNRPRCDVFWNNEIVNTLRLKDEGLLQSSAPVQADYYPARYKDPERQWYGFAARARVLVVHNDLVPEGQEPRSLFDLTQPRWRGKVGIARPLFGTTASHVACLFAALGETRAAAWLSELRANEVRVLSGNRDCARQVAEGHLACALTDTDDAMLEISAGKALRMVYLDDAPDALGTLFIPNTLSLIKGCPNPDGGVRLINYLLSDEVERRLADGPSAQIPLNRRYTGNPRVKTPLEVTPMKVDLAEAARQFDKAAEYIRRHFLN